MDNPSTAFSENRYQAETVSINVVVLPTNFTLFPNLVNDFVSVASDQNTIGNIQIYDVKGWLLYESQINTANVNLDLSHFKAGIYFVKIASEKGEITKKLVKN